MTPNPDFKDRSLFDVERLIETVQNRDTVTMKCYLHTLYSTA